MGISEDREECPPLPHPRDVRVQGSSSAELQNGFSHWRLVPPAQGPGNPSSPGNTGSPDLSPVRILLLLPQMGTQDLRVQPVAGSPAATFQVCQGIRTVLLCCFMCFQVSFFPSSFAICFGSWFSKDASLDMLCVCLQTPPWLERMVSSCFRQRNCWSWAETDSNDRQEGES